MSPNLKKLSLILGLLFIACLIGWGLYTLFRGGTVTETPPGGTGAGTGTETGTLPGSGTRSTTAQTGEPGSEGGLPSSGIVTSPNDQNYYRPEQVRKITDDYTQFPSLTLNGNVRYHNPADGRFYTIGPDGKLRTLSDQVFYNVKNVTWSSAANKAVIEYPDSTKIIYNFDTKKQVTLPKHWEEFSFSPDGNEVAAKSLGLSSDNRWLITTRDDGTGTQLIEPLGDNASKVIMAWSPSKQAVAFSQTGEPQGADRREVLLVGLNGENFKSLIVEGLDFQPKWSPTGKKLVYSVDSARSEFKPELWVVNSYGEAIGSGRKLLNVNTWASKCTFAGDDAIICAVPRFLPEGAGMAPEIAADTPDDMFRIDLKSGIKTQINLDQDYTISSISYDSTNKKVYFTDNHLSGAFEVSI